MPEPATFPVEPLLKEDQLPPLSQPQQKAVRTIRESGGTYVRSTGGDWLPPDGERLSPAARKHFRLTDRTVTGLIRSGHLAVLQELAGKPVKIRLMLA